MYIPESLVTITGPIVVCPVCRDSIFHNNESESAMKKTLSILFGAILGGMLITGLALEQQVPACPTEDSDNCYWDAELMGDGTGRSFTVTNGEVTYWDGQP